MPLSPNEEAIARAAFDAFCEAARSYRPPDIAPWQRQSEIVKRAWLAAGVAARGVVLNSNT